MASTEHIKMSEHVSDEHLKTAGVVKHVHSELRRKLRSGKPFLEVNRVLDWTGLD